MKKRVELETRETCVRCGDLLPAGMAAYVLSGDDGTGYLHYGKCRGTVRIEKEAQKLDLKKVSTMILLKSIPSSAPGAVELIIQELVSREQSFRKKVEDALEEIEQDERLGYPTATVDVNAPLALIQCGLNAQVRALKYVLMVLDVKDGEK
jgi:hypothetical protein